MSRVNGMPVRCVITKKIRNIRLINGEYEPGTILELNDSDFGRFNYYHPGAIQEIEMTEEDWINLATSRALECKKRINELQQLYGEQFSSNYCRVIPSPGCKVDGSSFGGDLKDAYYKTIILKKEIENFEKQCQENLGRKAETIHK